MVGVCAFGDLGSCVERGRHIHSLAHLHSLAYSHSLVLKPWQGRNYSRSGGWSARFWYGGSGVTKSPLSASLTCSDSLTR